MQWRWLPPEWTNTDEPQHAPWSDADTVLVMPATDRALAERAAGQLAERAGVDSAELLLVETPEEIGPVTMVNRCFRATQSQYFGYLQQHAHGGRHWLQLALDTLQKEERLFLGFNDGEWQGMLARHGLGRRNWLAGNYAGDLFCPDYTQNYADTELTLLAIDANVYAYNPNAVVVEVTWAQSRNPVNTLDRALFGRRKAGNLGQRIHKKPLLELFR